MLTNREIEVLERLVEGRMNKEIAVELFVSPHTIKSHVKHLMGKLNARNRAHLAAIAVRRGLIN